MRTAAHAPDSAPHKRVKDAGSHTAAYSCRGYPIASVWGGRIVSDSTLTSRINAARKAVGDSGEDQKLIRTIARKGFRFVGDVRAQSDAENGT